ncbi:hypothetical protein GPECTOR_41g628 [Gonium pectorale]|uniref:Uncharacterized protein n=1 Tax=Gonium pectorale TaxID=33097 RepID=A0A150G9Z3_GONPE|nr:hypothetical protein GPECTOR_41g628 [Gonium pectorale]|eukprot:KXZ46664.1 hypothetical protein GPECTOR_41g628 [Gonium pectorale]
MQSRRMLSADKYLLALEQQLREKEALLQTEAGYAMSDVRVVNSSYPTIQSAIVRSRGGATAASSAAAAGSRGNGESGWDTTGGGPSMPPESVPAEAAHGRVDVWVGGMWGAVSSAGFGRSEAVVA